MKAVWLTEFGGPEVLIVRDTPDPVPAPGQVLVAVAAVSITFIETVVRAGPAPWPTGGPVPPYVPGNGVGGSGDRGRAGCRRRLAGARVVGTTGGTGGLRRAGRCVSGPLWSAYRTELTSRQATALLADGRTATGLVEVAAPRAGRVGAGRGGGRRCRIVAGPALRRRPVPG